MRQVTRRFVLAGMACMLLHAGGWAGAHDVYRYTRPIQCDGFLMEWSESEARPLGGMSGAVWDACNTPQGLAGYVRWTSGDSCRGIMLALLPSRNGFVPVTIDSGDSANPGVTVASAIEESWETLEFAVAWHRLGVDTAGSYECILSCSDTCGGEGAVHVTGNRFTMLQRILTPRLKAQVAVSIALLLAYLSLHLHIRRKRARNSSAL